MLSPDGITYIGDRPAQICAIVTGASLSYVADKLNPFEVFERIEQYVDAHISAPDASSSPHTFARWRQYMLQPRRIVLSTGLMWAVKYEGMAVKQLMQLLRSSFVTPHIFVMPVPENTLVGREANTKLLGVCVRTQFFRDNVTWLGSRMVIQGDERWPAQPSPAEVLAIVDIVNNTRVEQA